MFGTGVVQSKAAAGPKQAASPKERTKPKALTVLTTKVSAKKVLQSPDPDQAKQKRRLLQLRQGREPTFEDIETTSFGEGVVE